MNPYLLCPSHRSPDNHTLPVRPEPYTKDLFTTCPLCHLRLQLWQSLNPPGANPLLSWPCPANGYIESNLLSCPSHWLPYILNPKRKLNDLSPKARSFKASECLAIEHWRARRGAALQFWKKFGTVPKAN